MKTEQTYTSTAPDMQPDQPVYVGWMVVCKESPNFDQGWGYFGKRVNGHYMHGPFETYDGVLKNCDQIKKENILEVIAICEFFYQEGDRVVGGRKEERKENIIKKAIKNKKEIKHGIPMYNGVRGHVDRYGKSGMISTIKKFKVNTKGPRR